MTREEIKKELHNCIFSVLDEKEYKAFIFGSQANLKELKRSDIDVGFQGNNAIDYMLLFNIKTN